MIFVDYGQVFDSSTPICSQEHKKEGNAYN